MNTTTLWEEKNSTEQLSKLENKLIFAPNNIISETKLKFDNIECNDIGNKKKWKKICPNCEREVFYTSKEALVRSIKCGRNCLKCKSIIKDRYVGQRFGKLTIIKQYYGMSPSNIQIVKVDYKCDCGNIVINKRYGSVKRQKTCFICKKTNSFKSLGDGVAAFGTLYKDYKNGSKIRKHSFDLDEDSFRKLTKGNCFYCGQLPSSIKKTGNCSGEYIYNGIDRKDNTKGYTLENCVSCCKTCNFCKVKLSDVEFLTHVKKIYDYQFRTIIKL